MKDIRLKGYNEKFKGSKTNPITDTQKSIFKAIELALGIYYNHENYTSYSAWNIIKKYSDRIILRYYTNDKNEKPTICIDGMPVYKEEDVDEETVHLIESIAVMKADTEDDYYDILYRLSKLPKSEIVSEYKKIFKK